MTALAVLRSLPHPWRAPVVGRVYPRIVLADCSAPLCVAGRVRYVAGGRVIDQQCCACAGHGTVTVEGALA